MQQQTDCGACGGTGEIHIERTVPGCCGSPTETGECCGNAVPIQVDDGGPCPYCVPQECVSWFTKNYHCTCGEAWTTEYDSLCKDRCPGCGEYCVYATCTEEAIPVEVAVSRSSTTLEEYRAWGSVRLSVPGPVHREELGDSGWEEQPGGLHELPPVDDDSEAGDGDPLELEVPEARYAA